MQQSFKRIAGWGGRRKHAGRKNLSGKINHHRRARVDMKQPLHITQKLNPKLPSLRTKSLLKIFKNAVKRARGHGLHVLQYTLLNNHLHLIVEAKDNDALGRGLRTVFISMAKAINKSSRRIGAVFKDRYHLTEITCPTQMKHALEYVLLNQAKHRRAEFFVDDYSSAPTFKHWEKLLGPRMTKAFRIRVEIDLDLSSPTSWLARVGWMRAA